MGFIRPILCATASHPLRSQFRLGFAWDNTSRSATGKKQEDKDASNVKCGN